MRLSEIQPTVDLAQSCCGANFDESTEAHLAQEQCFKKMHVFILPLTIEDKCLNGENVHPEQVYQVRCTRTLQLDHKLSDSYVLVKDSGSPILLRGKYSEKIGDRLELTYKLSRIQETTSRLEIVEGGNLKDIETGEIWYLDKEKSTKEPVSCKSLEPYEGTTFKFKTVDENSPFPKDNEIYFLKVDQSYHTDRSRGNLLKLHEVDFIKKWLDEIKTKLPENTPFIIGESERSQEFGGVTAWNYFDIGAGIHQNGFHYDAEIQKWVKSKSATSQIPGIIYTHDVDLGAVANEVFESLAALRFKNAGLEHFQETRTFQVATYSLDDVFVSEYQDLRKNIDQIDWQKKVDKINKSNMHHMRFAYHKHKTPLLENPEQEIERNSALQQLMTSSLKIKIANVLGVPVDKIPVKIRYEFQTVSTMNMAAMQSIEKKIMMPVFEYSPQQ